MVSSWCDVLQRVQPWINTVLSAARVPGSFRVLWVWKGGKPAGTGGDLADRSSGRTAVTTPSYPIRASGGGVCHSEEAVTACQWSTVSPGVLMDICMRSLVCRVCVCVCMQWSLTAAKLERTSMSVHWEVFQMHRAFCSYCEPVKQKNKNKKRTVN